MWDHSQVPLSQESLTHNALKAVAIIGAGSGGLGALKAVLDLPSDVRKDWRIDLFEQRHDVGGIWLPDPDPPAPPKLPETPLYTQLRTNTPHPTMTYPHFPFPPRTPLYPSHPHVQAYHSAFATHYNLTSHIHLSHRVLHAAYSPVKRWTLSVLANNSNLFNRTYDHLIVANGHSNYPLVPKWDGSDDWLDDGRGMREIVHSLWYRDPDPYANRTVIVVGGGASGRDIAAQVVPVAKKVYHSYSNDSLSPVSKLPAIQGTHPKPSISRLTRSSIIFADNSTLRLSGPASIILGTGYQLLAPFLLSPDLLGVDPAELSTNVTLTTNTRYLQPLHNHIFALAPPSLPTNALAFVGLPVWIANAPSDYAQGLYIAHAIASGQILDEREQLLHDLAESHATLRGLGFEPEKIGHRFVIEGSATDYQNSLIAILRARSPIPLPEYLRKNASEPYVEPWRSGARGETFSLMKAWVRAEKEGVAEHFVREARTEEDWVKVMDRLREWGSKRTEEDGEP